MKASLIVCLAAIAAPSLSMKMSHLVERQDPSTPTTDPNAAPAPSSSADADPSSSGGGDGAADCASLEAKHEYFLAQVAELQSQHIAVPAYLAGYASAAADTLDTLGCSAGKSNASDGQEGKSNASDGKEAK